jgi:hypothetical protein
LEDVSTVGSLANGKRCGIRLLIQMRGTVGRIDRKTGTAIPSTIVSSCIGKETIRPPSELKRTRRVRLAVRA